MVFDDEVFEVEVEVVEELLVEFEVVGLFSAYLFSLGSNCILDIDNFAINSE